MNTDYSTSHVSDLSMVGDMGIITRGEDYVMNFPRPDLFDIET